MKGGSTPPLAECPLLPLGSRILWRSSSYSTCHAGCVSVLFFQGPIPFLVQARIAKAPTDVGCHAAIDCVASVFPFTSTARKRMLLPMARGNGPA